ncbi:TolC family protein [Pseudodesulfovibrio karagichevae]|uniref:TolC family protein n=1 Tax=Pseudodesulfovibrio karagichevae TaxID=3239305 RepID=A0ABV4K0L0_9BACT
MTILKSVSVARLAAVMALPLVLAGCAARMDLTAKKAEIKGIMPGAWQTPASDFEVAKDITGLIDTPQMRALIAEALSANPDLTATAYRLKAAGLLLSVTSSARLPELTVGGSGARTNSSGREAASFSIRSDVSWEVDLWQRLADLNDAAALEVKAKSGDYMLARNALAARVVRAWIDLAAKSRAVAIEQRRIKALLDTEEIILERYNMGLGNLTDLDAARTKSEAAREVLAGRELDLTKARRVLELLLGQYPSGTIAGDVKLPSVANPLVGIPSEVLADRIDIRAAWDRVRKSDLDVAAANKAMLPSFKITADISNTSKTIHDLTTGQAIWNLVGALTQPVFMGGRLKDTAAAKSEESKAAWEDYRKVVLEAMQEVENGLDSERGLARRREHLEKSLSYATQSRINYEQRYREGLSDIINLLTAKETELNTEIQLLQVRALQLDNRAQLALASGLNADLNTEKPTTEK